MGKQSIIFNCVKCGEYNATMYPSKSDVTSEFLGQQSRSDPPISYVSRAMDIYVGFRRCKKCKTWQVVVFCGWYYRPNAFAYLPERVNDNQGTIGLDVAKWVIKQARLKGIKVPRVLLKEIKT